MHYIKLLVVPLEPFFQVNYNAYLHSPSIRRQAATLSRGQGDYQGRVAELLAKATRQSALDAAVSKEDRQMLLESLRQWGALDKDFGYVSSDASSDRRGFEKDPGGGLSARPIPSKPMGLHDVLDSGLWAGITNGDTYENACHGIPRHDTARTGVTSARLRQPNSPAIPQGIRERCCGCMAPSAVYDGLLRHVDFRD